MAKSQSEGPRRRGSGRRQRLALKALNGSQQLTETH